MKTLAERIKDLPKGTKLYSPCYGEVTFISIDDAGEIEIIDNYRVFQTFESDGRVCEHGECMLFPSKEDRDWDKFLAGRNKFDVRTLQPFDKVLVRDGSGRAWEINFFEYYEPITDNYRFSCMLKCWEQCVPYNDETKHLLGTTDRAPEYYITWKEE